MEKHEKVNIVSRDRSTDYSTAIASTNRQIVEVADKFHLIKNIMDRITRLVAENFADYRQVVRGMEKNNTEVEDSAITSISSVNDTPAKKPDSREIMFQEVKELQ